MYKGQEFSIGIVCPYFGKMEPEHMKLWYQCCAYNPEIDFIIISDDAELEKRKRPDNVRFIWMTWESCSQRIQNLYDFHIALQYKYKICDLRPAFGEIFREYLQDYTFWGHMDVSDTLFGNLRKFVTDDILRSRDKIHMYGHFVLYRNTEEVNARYKINLKSGKSYKDVFMLEETMCFDDMYHEISICQIYRENRFSKIDRIPMLVSDILPYYYSFWCSQDQGRKIPRAYEWEKGMLTEITLEGGEICRQEIGYVHYQKRKIDHHLAGETDHYYLVPNSIVPVGEVSVSSAWLEEISRDKLYLDPLVGRIKRIYNYAKNPKVFLRKFRATVKSGN